jgi:hypothetical protein
MTTWALSVGSFVTQEPSLPPGITVADLKREHVFRPRNPLIAGVFFRRGLIERWGQGYPADRGALPHDVAAGSGLRGAGGNLAVRYRISQYAPPLRVSHDLADRQREVLQILSNGERWRFRDLVARMVEPPAPRTLRDDLQMLKKLGLVDSGGRSASARWWLKSQAEKGGEGRTTAANLNASVGKPRRYFLWETFEIAQVTRTKSGDFRASGPGWQRPAH